jgi:hypothetical protein
MPISSALGALTRYARAMHDEHQQLAARYDAATLEQRGHARAAAQLTFGGCGGDVTVEVYVLVRETEWPPPPS